ncbi:MAG: hypothetical protein Fur006_01090 [Coleofasciculaceae cyanobacterium]
MKHIVDGITHKALDPDLYQKVVDAQQEEVKISQLTPYRQIAYLWAIVYCSILVVVSLPIKLLWKIPVNSIYNKLANIYYWVPEMALHKGIELEAYLQHKYVGKGLDLGCGNGLVGGILIEFGGLSELHGVDLHEHNQTLALENGYASFTTGDIQSLPYPDRSFDYAISICVIEHIPNLIQSLSEINRVLKPGGRLFFSTPSPLFRESTLGYRFFKFIGMHKKAEAFKLQKDINSVQYHYLSPIEWDNTLKETGFDDIEVQGIFSRFQLLIYDLLNIQVNWLRIYFADKLCVFLFHHPKFKKIMIDVTERISAYFSKKEVEILNATHYFISCSKERY